MATKKSLGYGLWAGVMVAVLAQGAWANNFKAAADKTGCDSLITSDAMSACKTVQGEKNTACNIKTECDDDKQQRIANEYNERVKNWDKLSPSDKEASKSNVKSMFEELVRRKAAAVAGETIAKSCIKARDNVQKWFEDVAIPLTERMKSAAASVRKEAVEKHKDAVDKRDAAKKKLDDKPSDDSLRREWEAARALVAELQGKLEEINNRLGPDIEYHADRLVKHYQSEKTNHDGPSKQAENRLSNCEKTQRISWESLPSGI